jgi:putative membrane protein insertion efficiency factor
MLRALCVLPIRLYQLLVSPLTPKSCRFLPTCSHYAVEAISTHGVLHGGWLAARRVLRCHPWGTWGYDPVPPPHAHGAARHGDGCVPSAR